MLHEEEAEVPARAWAANAARSASRLWQLSCHDKLAVAQASYLGLEAMTMNGLTLVSMLMALVAFIISICARQFFNYTGLLEFCYYVIVLTGGYATIMRPFVLEGFSSVLGHKLGPRLDAKCRLLVVLGALLGVISIALVACVAVGVIEPQFSTARLLFGLPYFPLKKVTLDFVGYVFGFLVCAAVFTYMCCCCCCCQCCFRSRLLRPQQPADGPTTHATTSAFVDTIENKTMVSFFTPMVFVFGFGFICAFVLVGSALVSPDQLMPREPTTPQTLVALCRGSL